MVQKWSPRFPFPHRCRRDPAHCPSCRPPPRGNAHVASRRQQFSPKVPAIKHYYKSIKIINNCYFSAIEPSKPKSSSNKMFAFARTCEEGPLPAMCRPRPQSATASGYLHIYIHMIIDNYIYIYICAEHCSRCKKDKPRS
eukprot:COSAG06_NODE_10638_length_1644_cov_1.295793_2_plen_140_part_00